MDKLQRANDARNLLDNPIHKEAVQAVRDYVENRALKIDPNNAEAAKTAILAKQIAHRYISEIERIIEDGRVEEVRIEQLEKKPLLKFNRGY